jgi:hypothetical protein
MRHPLHGHGHNDMAMTLLIYKLAILIGTLHMFIMGVDPLKMRPHPSIRMDMGDGTVMCYDGWSLWDRCDNIPLSRFRFPIYAITYNPSRTTDVDPMQISDELKHLGPGIHCYDGQHLGPCVMDQSVR